MSLQYEKMEHFITEKHTRNGLSRDHLNQNEWQRPIYQTVGNHPRTEFSSSSTRMPAERIVDDYRRVDYEYDGDNFVQSTFSVASSHSSHKLQGKPYTAMKSQFRDFDEDDLESYLEGSVWSEKPACDMYSRSNLQSDVITVFPCTSSLSYYPSSSCETVFTVRRPPSVVQYRNSVADNKSDYGYDRQRAASRSEYSSPNSDRGRQYEKAVVEKAVSRPGSPGPVAGQGQIINTEHGFTIELDVNHFRANEIKVSLNESLLCVNGERIEDCGDGQSLRRSFSRKYSIPTDIHLDSIKSHLTDYGILVINGSRNGWKETNIYVQSGRSRRESQSIISTV